MEGRTLSLTIALNPDLAFHHLNELARQEQPQTCATLLTIEIALETNESLEDVALLVARNAIAPVTHLHLDKSTRGIDNRYTNGRMLWGIFLSIDQQILQDTLDLRRVANGLHGHWRDDRDL